MLQKPHIKLLVFVGIKNVMIPAGQDGKAGVITQGFQRTDWVPHRNLVLADLVRVWKTIGNHTRNTQNVIRQMLSPAS